MFSKFGRPCDLPTQKILVVRARNLSARLAVADFIVLL